MDGGELPCAYVMANDSFMGAKVVRPTATVPVWLWELPNLVRVLYPVGTRTCKAKDDGMAGWVKARDALWPNENFEPAWNTALCNEMRKNSKTFRTAKLAHPDQVLPSDEYVVPTSLVFGMCMWAATARRREYTLKEAACDLIADLVDLMAADHNFAKSIVMVTGGPSVPVNMEQGVLDFRPNWTYMHSFQWFKEFATWWDMFQLEKAKSSQGVLRPESLLTPRVGKLIGGLLRFMVHQLSNKQSFVQPKNVAFLLVSEAGNAMEVMLSQLVSPDGQVVERSPGQRRDILHWHTDPSSTRSSNGNMEKDCISCHATLASTHT